MKTRENNSGTFSDFDCMQYVLSLKLPVLCNQIRNYVISVKYCTGVFAHKIKVTLCVTLLKFMVAFS